MKNKFTLAALFVLFIPLTVFPLSLVVRTYDHPDFTRLVFESVAGFHYKVFQSTTSLEVQLKEKADLKEEIPTQSVLIDKIVHRLENNKSVVNIRLKTPFKVQRGFVLENPFRLVFDLVSTGKPVASTAKEEIKSDATTPETTKVDTPKAETGAPKPEVANPTPPPSQTTASETPLSQKKPGAIETICIDPGHGGSD
ncbi:MAG: MurNAc-LAA protein, partial [Acidobacteriota bacterium]|nr:MurNAc-LAA protein [Acidobacteriota bacterium]